MSNDLGLIPISSLTLRAEVPLVMDLYSWIPGMDSPRLFVASQTSMPSETIAKIASMSELKLYIDRRARRAYQDHLRETLDDATIQATLSGVSRAAMLSEVVRDVLADSFHGNSTETIVGSAMLLGKHVSCLFADSSLSGLELTQILHHDYGTFTHSANVGFYACLLAMRLGIEGSSLSEIAIGGFVHDIGKLDIDDRILNKPGRLDEFEFRTIKTHPLIGYRRLCDDSQITQKQLMMAYQHHEKLDGTGYPVGITTDEITLEAKICSVVDVYEALTSHRPYRSAMSPEQALSLMQREVGKSFDSEIFRCWTNVVKLT